MADTKDVEFFRKLWLKAAEVGELHLPIKDLKARERTRMRLYSAVKDVKKPGAHFNLNLVQAVHDLMLCSTETGLVLRRRELDETIQELSRITGVSLGEVESESERQAREMREGEAEAMRKFCGGT